MTGPSRQDYCRTVLLCINNLFHKKLYFKIERKHEYMKIEILDDYQHIIDKLKCFKLLLGQNVKILDRNEKNPKILTEKLKDTGMIVLTRERTAINEALLSLLPNLKRINQPGKIFNHLNLSHCTKRKVAVAYDDFKMTNKGQDTIKINGLTTDQCFFLSLALI